jgi:hypothetical protein
MSPTNRESTLPTDHQIEQNAARYAELYPNGRPPKAHRLMHLVRRVLGSLRRSAH